MRQALAMRLANTSKLVVVVVFLALVVSAVVAWSARDTSKTVTVEFSETTAVYEGSDVKVLGVAIGKVEKLTPRGDAVVATISYDDQYDLPRDVKAAIVSPAIVGDRYVQFAPAYTEGPTLEDGATIGNDRTAVPVELDEVYASISDLSVALGPDGANDDGSLSRLVDNLAGQLDGQGAQVNETIQNFSKLATTLDSNSEDLFGSVREVQEFVEVLNRNDETVRAFNDSTAQVSEVLEGERDDLAETLSALSTALTDVNTLVTENRDVLRSNVDKIESLSQVLRTRQGEFEELLVAAPTALSNIALTYNGNYGTLDNRAGLEELLLGGIKDPAGLLCNLLDESTDDALCGTLSDLLDPILGGLSPRTAPGSAPMQAEKSASSLAEMMEVPQ
ncbi:MCE family protein [Aeromicrobium sp. YIM 150415]|uniref:MCE family protein n=1 Tax=Aeromicrobium sp. YIM 150415 TaxID=2803912 RepID=UPI0019630904|nr:MCE family protein [Aeromicrobium sp. YIM 150415]MBM9464870.1 MCE family protein [Aeromicrobium sp. YIM 150415]